MKAALCTSLEGYQSLKLTDIECPSPKKGEVLIRVHAAALNFADSLIVKGKYQTRPSLPFSPGLECAGEIAELGEGVTRFQKGDPVMAILDYGGFAEYAIAKESDCFSFGSGLDFETAASIPVAYGTSHHGLMEMAKLKAGEWLVVHGAAGGVGLTALQVAKQAGARIIATASTNEKLDICRDNGAEHVFLSEPNGLRDKIKNLTDGLGAHVVYDPVGGDLFTESLRSTRPGGRILIVGFASGDIPQIPANIMLVKNITCIGYHWGAYRHLDPASLHRSFSELIEWVEKGRLSPHISKVFELEDIHSAYDFLLARKSTGKVIIRIG